MQPTYAFAQPPTHHARRRYSSLFTPIRPETETPYTSVENSAASDGNGHRPRVVGYIRVSTEKQNAEDLALERQARLLREFAAARGFDLSWVYEDVGSAVEVFSADRRFGLRDVTKLAMRETAAILVTEPTRLFRDRRAAEQWLGQFDGAIWSVADGYELTREEFLDRVSAGELRAKALKEATKSALSARRKKGQPLGSPTDKSKANAASARARALRSADIVVIISNILLEDCAYRDLSHQALADLLNRRGLMTGWNRPWTAQSIRRSRKLAEERVAEFEAIEAEEMPTFKPEAPAPGTVQVSDTEREAAELEQIKTLPNAGIF